MFDLDCVFDDNDGRIPVLFELIVLIYLSMVLIGLVIVLIVLSNVLFILESIGIFHYVACMKYLRLTYNQFISTTNENAHISTYA